MLLKSMGPILGVRHVKRQDELGKIPGLEVHFSGSEYSREKVGGEESAGLERMVDRFTEDKGAM